MLVLKIPACVGMNNWIVLFRRTRPFWTRSRGGWSMKPGLDASIYQYPLESEKLVFAQYGYRFFWYFDWINPLWISFMVGNTYVSLHQYGSIVVIVEYWIHNSFLAIYSRWLAPRFDTCQWKWNVRHFFCFSVPWVNETCYPNSDGFALNVGIEEWQKDRVRDCFHACERLPRENKFRLFFSFDMTYNISPSSFKRIGISIISGLGQFQVNQRRTSDIYLRIYKRSSIILGHYGFHAPLGKSWYPLSQVGNVFSGWIP